MMCFERVGVEIWSTEDSGVRNRCILEGREIVSRLGICSLFSGCILNAGLMRWPERDSITLFNMGGRSLLAATAANSGFDDFFSLRGL